MGNRLLLQGEIIASTSLIPLRVRKSGREKMPIPRLVHTARYSVESTLSRSDSPGPGPPAFQKLTFRGSSRQICLFDRTKDSPVQKITFDMSPAALTPHYDDDTRSLSPSLHNMVY